MLKVGLVGCGYWGPKLARNFHELPETELAWVCDFRQDRLDHLKALYPQVQATRDYTEMLASDVEAVVIATPVRAHHPLALAALRAGKHVLIEKPLAGSVKEAEEIVAEGERAGRVVMVGHTFEYNPAVETMRKIITDGELGDVYYINATRVNLGLFQPDINVMWDLAPHDVSLLMFALGLSPTEVSARGAIYVRPHSGLHEVVYLTLYFPNNVLADIRVSWLDPCKIRRCTVVGSKKMLVYDDIADDKILLYDKGVDIPPYSDTLEEFHLSYRTGEGIPYPVPWSEPLRGECRHFAECIATGQRPRSDGLDGLRVVKVLDMAQRSLINGGAREVLAW